MQNIVWHMQCSIFAVLGKSVIKINSIIKYFLMFKGLNFRNDFSTRLNKSQSFEVKFNPKSKIMSITIYIIIMTEIVNFRLAPRKTLNFFARVNQTRIRKIL